MNEQTVITFRSKARRWPDLANCIHDALFDAQHGRQGLLGASPSLLVLLSRDLLCLGGQQDLAALKTLSEKLELQGVRHSFHCSAPGSRGPATHMIRILVN